MVDVLGAVIAALAAAAAAVAAIAAARPAPAPIPVRVKRNARRRHLTLPSVAHPGQLGQQVGTRPLLPPRTRRRRDVQR